MPKFGIGYYIDRLVSFKIEAEDEESAKRIAHELIDGALAEVPYALVEKKGEQEGVVEVERIK